ncbi:MAG: hypothetical protein E3K38_12635 [Candidatus Kuenenia stuttgartiensis]|nr:hypothetical protein [Candidatus Kuenenia stuttgartiensis]
MIFNELPEFVKECKRLAKKYQSLPDDLEEFKRVITVVPLGNSKHFNAITINDRCTIIKARLFCRYLKGSSLRIIYAFHDNNLRADLIEIYFKGDKEHENHERIKEYLNNL